MGRILPLLTIRVRVLALVFAAVLPLLALLLMGALGDRRAALDYAALEVDSAARLAAERQSRVFDEARILLRTLSFMPGVEPAGSDACSSTVSRAASQNPQFMTIGVIDAQGTIVCHSAMRTRQAFTDQDLVARTIVSPAGEIVLGRVIIGRVTGRPTIVLGMPLARATGDAPGLLFASLDLSVFSANAEREQAGDAMRTVTVVDAAGGKVVAGSGAQRDLIGRSFAGHEIVKALAALPGGGTIALAGFNGRDEIIGFAPLHAEGLSRPVITVAIPRDAALAEADKLAINRLGIALLVTALACAAAWAFGYWTLALPIGQLTAVAARIGSGDLSSRAEPQSWQPREMLLLGATLNAMASRLDVATRRLQLLANEDALTGLANRRRFDAALQSECARYGRMRQPLSLLIVDVDHFKRYNDDRGHVAGDDCLKRIGGVIATFARRPGDVAARYGGEEFALILPSTDAAGAACLAAAIRDGVRALGIPNAASADGIMTVSVGSATIVEHARADTRTPHQKCGRGALPRQGGWARSSLHRPGNSRRGMTSS